MKGLRDFLLVPAAPVAAAARPAVAARTAAPAPVIGLVAERRDASALAAALALVAARAAGLPCGLAAVHDATHAGEDDRDGAIRAWTTPAARRLATSLRARELSAAARGRLVTVRLPGEPAAAVLAAERTAAAAAGAATVLAAAGPRPAELDALLARCDLVLVAARPERAALAELAAEALRGLGGPAVAITVPARGAGRGATAGGLIVAPRVAAALQPALAVLRARA